MTAVAMNDFIARLRHDTDLAARLSAAVGNKDGEAAFAAVVAFAGQNGFDVTMADAEIFQARVQKAAAGEGELSDADLETVSGGGFGQAFLNIINTVRSVTKQVAPRSATEIKGV